MVGRAVQHTGAGGAPAAPQSLGAAPELLERQPENAGDARAPAPAPVLGLQQHLRCDRDHGLGRVVRERDPVAVEDAAPHGRLGDGAGVHGRSRLRVVRVLTSWTCPSRPSSVPRSDSTTSAEDPQPGRGVRGVRLTPAAAAPEPAQPRAAPGPRGRRARSSGPATGRCPPRPRVLLPGRLRPRVAAASTSGRARHDQGDPAERGPPLAPSGAGDQAGGGIQQRAGRPGPGCRAA